MELSSSQNSEMIVAGPVWAQPAEASACGKAILVGEHAVVYGSKAVAVPLNQMRLSLQICPEAVNHGSAISSDSILGKHLQSLLAEALRVLELPEYAFAISGNSDLPIGAGVGSSASLCVAMLRVIAKSLALPIDPQRLAALANQLERRFHGSPSGLDASVVAYERPVAFTRANGVEPLNLTMDSVWRFALVDCGARAATKAMIHLAQPHFVGSAGERRLAKFDEIAVAAVAALESGTPWQLAPVMRDCGKLLAEVGVVTDLLGQIIAKCQEIGCLAAKTTGAGGGGVVLALLDPERSGEQLARLQQVFGRDAVYAVCL